MLTTLLVLAYTFQKDPETLALPRPKPCPSFSMPLEGASTSGYYRYTQSRSLFFLSFRSPGSVSLFYLYRYRTSNPLALVLIIWLDIVTIPGTRHRTHDRVSDQPLPICPWKWPDPSHHLSQPFQVPWFFNS
ncbi:unnamed protein product [Tuber melanosporum]|uniref:(Perigord truffle) hypothetical protein n=1 Tax=Tuber melanosporum (strain Mel28) TaxID=656061 RepID=D5GMN6_TUBMM|nr:uncharacterized protein GSTUM_00010832001 [Tuber melanosporum]CAZ85779.1 unnamed protein product [Tuber melanosporum]